MNTCNINNAGNSVPLSTSNTESFTHTKSQADSLEYPSVEQHVQVDSREHPSSEFKIKQHTEHPHVKPQDDSQTYSHPKSQVKLHEDSQVETCAQTNICSRAESHAKSQAKQNICFGYTTALEILRNVHIPKKSPTYREKFEIPKRAPHKEEVLSTVRQIEAAYPAVHIKKPLHVIVRNPGQSRTSLTCKVHSSQESLICNSLQRLQNSVFVSTAPLAFTQIAANAKNKLALIQLGYEICGTYQTKLTGNEASYNVAPLTSLSEIRNFVERNSSINGAEKVKKALRYIADGSASPRETKLALLLGMPLSYGGYGLGIPQMNYRVENNKAATSISGRSYLKCDLCWPSSKIDVEYQSREMHAGEESRIRDSRRINALAAMGWKTVCITNDELDSAHTMDTIAETIRKHLKKRCRVTVLHYRQRKIRLRMQLGLPVGNE